MKGDQYQSTKWAHNVKKNKWKFYKFTNFEFHACHKLN